MSIGSNTQQKKNKQTNKQICAQFKIDVCATKNNCNDWWLICRWIVWWSVLCIFKCIDIEMSKMWLGNVFLFSKNKKSQLPKMVHTGDLCCWLRSRKLSMLNVMTWNERRTWKKHTKTTMTMTTTTSMTTTAARKRKIFATNEPNQTNSNRNVQRKWEKKNKNHSQIYEIEFGILLYETSVTEWMWKKGNLN